MICQRKFRRTTLFSLIIITLESSNESACFNDVCMHDEVSVAYSCRLTLATRDLLDSTSCLLES